MSPGSNIGTAAAAAVAAVVVAATVVAVAAAVLVADDSVEEAVAAPVESIVRGEGSFGELVAILLFFSS